MPRQWEFPLKCEQAGLYVTHDGRYEITLGHTYDYCEADHPVRLGKVLRRKIIEAAAKNGWDKVRYQEGMRGVAESAFWAARTGAKGYTCYAGTEHAKDSWGVWDRQKDDYVDDGGIHFDTMTEAREYLEDHLKSLEKAT